MASRSLFVLLFARDRGSREVRKFADNLVDSMRKVEAVQKKAREAQEALRDSITKSNDAISEQIKLVDKHNAAMAKSTAIKEQTRLTTRYTTASNFKNKALEKQIKLVERHNAALTKGKDLLPTDDTEKLAKETEKVTKARKGSFKAMFEAEGFMDVFDSFISAARKTFKRMSVLLKVALTAGVIAALPLIGSVLGAAVLGGVGTGGIVGGVVGAFQDPRVQKAFANFKAFLLREGSIVGRNFFMPSVLRSFALLEDTIRKTVRVIGPELRALGPVVLELTSGVASMIGTMLPGLKAALGAAAPVLRALAGELPGLGHAFSEMFRHISEGSDGAILGLIQLMRIIGGLIIAIGIMIRGLSNVFEFLHRAQAKVAGALENILGFVPLIGGVLRHMEGTSKSAINSMEGAKNASDILGRVGSEAQELLEGAFEATNEEIKIQTDLLRAQVDPVFSLLKADQEVKEAQEAYNAALAAHGPKSKAAKDAADNLAFAVASMDAAARVAADQGLDGKISPAMKRAMVAAGFTKEQIAAVAGRFREAATAGDEYTGTYKAEVILINGDRIKAEFDEIGRMVRAIQGTYSVTFLTSYQQATPKGPAKAMQHGGEVIGPRGTDKIPAMLTAGEFVVRRDVAQRHMRMLQELNAGRAMTSPSVVRGLDSPPFARSSPSVGFGPSPRPSKVVKQNITVNTQEINPVYHSEQIGWLLVTRG